MLSLHLSTARTLQTVIRSINDIQVSISSVSLSTVCMSHGHGTLSIMIAGQQLGTNTIMKALGLEFSGQIKVKKIWPQDLR
jgi:hypothetical protein